MTPDTRHLRPDLARRRAIAEARRWVGTPFHHQASRRGVGCDCLGLVRGVWRRLQGPEPERPPAYSGDWAEAAIAGNGGRKRPETMLEAARRHMVEIHPKEARSGDVVVFRWRAGRVAKHSAILVTAARMVHAFEGAGVVEVHFSPWWRRRVAGAFRFPACQVPGRQVPGAGSFASDTRHLPRGT